MAFTASDASSVSQLLHRWEVAEYISEAFVILGCAGELVADLATCISRRKRRHIERWSTILLVLALSIGLKCLIRTNELSGIVIGSLGEKAEQADKKANTALTDSVTALMKSGEATTKADAAKGVAGSALDKSNKANTVASSALVLAQSADQNAKLLRGDLEKASIEAKAAVARLEDEQTKAAAVEAELKKDEADAKREQSEIVKYVNDLLRDRQPRYNSFRALNFGLELSGFHFKLNVKTEYIANMPEAPEAAGLAVVIADTLSAVLPGQPFIVEPFKEDPKYEPLFPNMPPTGVVILTHFAPHPVANDNDPAWQSFKVSDPAWQLKDALEFAGVNNVQIRRTRRIKQDSLTIVVGVRAVSSQRPPSIDDQ